MFVFVSYWLLVIRLTLTLFVTWVFLVDHIQLALATNDLAIGAALFDGCSYLHITCI